MKVIANIIIVAVIIFVIVDVASSEFVVTYPPVQSGDQNHQAILKIYQDSRIFELYAQGLNQLKTPQRVWIVPGECGTVNAFYDSQKHAIFMCYELIDDFFELFGSTTQSSDQLTANVLGATTFVFFHEVGHALVAELQLPAVGREEDAVDQFSALVLANPETESMVVNGASWFTLKEQRNNSGFAGLEEWFLGSDLNKYADEHGLDLQRYYNLVCLIYGRDPNGHAQYVSDGLLPPQRAQRCPHEYAKIKDSWERLLEPYYTK